jgi:hypothetical protein
MSNIGTDKAQNIEKMINIGFDKAQNIEKWSISALTKLKILKK